MSSCDIPFTTSNTSLNLKLLMRDIARLSNFVITHFLPSLLPYLLTYLLRGAFAPKNHERVFMKDNFLIFKNWTVKCS